MIKHWERGSGTALPKNNERKSILTLLRIFIGRIRQVFVLSRLFLIITSILIALFNTFCLIYDQFMYAGHGSFLMKNTWYSFMVYSSSVALVLGMLGFVYSAITENVLHRKLAVVSLASNLLLLLLRFAFELVTSGFRPMFNEPGG